MSKSDSEGEGIVQEAIEYTVSNYTQRFVGILTIR